MGWLYIVCIIVNKFIILLRLSLSVPRWPGCLEASIQIGISGLYHAHDRAWGKFTPFHYWGKCFKWIYTYIFLNTECFTEFCQQHFIISWPIGQLTNCLETTKKEEKNVQYKNMFVGVLVFRSLRMKILCIKVSNPILNTKMSKCIAQSTAPPLLDSEMGWTGD